MNEKSPDLEEIVRRLKKLQAHSGLSDPEFALILGCTFVRVCRINGTDPAARFADVLRTEPAHLRSQPVDEKPPAGEHTS